MGRFHWHTDGSTHDDHHSHDHHRNDHHHGQDERIGDHSGYETGTRRVEVLAAILGENDRLAAANRHDFDAAGAHVVNLMSAPGAGKTALLRETLRRLCPTLRVGVIEGDIETSIDADRLDGLGAVVSLVNTGQGFGGECHLDAAMVRSAIGRLPLDLLDLVVIENVGNLVCPAEFDVGEHRRAMIFSVTEGEEKPLKYPIMFRSADLILINKVDLLPYLDFDLELFRRNLTDVNPGATSLEISARTGAGLGAWCDWLSAPHPPWPGAGRPAQRPDAEARARREDVS
ncbi:MULTISPECIES: hydrogenase nickel incorporation protein HypB [Protofrankia]|uniref:Hydrogenase accessory protein HypB n=1 Tax=Candidatus Protofrankia datiscae TaxID=2716812 RepID=F8B258_9ACTN|nr:MULTISPECIES: hydrogenase nickel incorporation protein HypB [Protofrankia]AEH09852.1 hydrogenase accessory protein HypB [Candidatus Protofrankia datiscae]